MLPSPKFITFYNGERNIADEVVLKLSDCFMGEGRKEMELEVRMLNINYGRNSGILERCRPLSDYSQFVACMREYRKQGYETGVCVHRAIRELGEDSALKGYLMSNEAEVAMLCITEFDEDRFREDMRKEGYEEGFEAGEASGEARGVAIGETKGASRMASLFNRLSDLGRIDDYAKAAKDPAYCNQLLAEFGIG